MIIFRDSLINYKEGKVSFLICRKIFLMQKHPISLKFGFPVYSDKELLTIDLKVDWLSIILERRLVSLLIYRNVFYIEMYLICFKFAIQVYSDKELL